MNITIPVLIFDETLFLLLLGVIAVFLLVWIFKFILSFVVGG